MLCPPADSPKIVDAMRVTAKGRDILLHPLERELLIHQTVVGVQMTFGVERRLREKAKQPQAVIDRHNNYAARLDQR